MKKSIFKDWDLSPIAIAYALFGLKPPTDKAKGKYWRKLKKPSKEQQAATIAACKVKPDRKALNRMACYCNGLFCQPIDNKYWRERHSEVIPF